jgi:squalene cyclase
MCHNVKEDIMMKLSEAYMIIRKELTDDQLEYLFEQIEEGAKWDRSWEDVLIEAMFAIKEGK